MELAEDLEDSMGQKLHHEGDMKNWYAWFGFEETVRNLYGEELGY